MQAEELAQMFDKPHREGRLWRARCPVHKSKGLTLAIYADAERCSVRCFAGCESDDILKAVGLTFKDCFYRKLSPKAMHDAQRLRLAQERRQSDLRIGEWIIKFIERGYTRGDYKRDVVCVCAWTVLLSVKAMPHRERGLTHHMERIIAVAHCKFNGIKMGANR